MKVLSHSRTSSKFPLHDAPAAQLSPEALVSPPLLRLTQRRGCLPMVKLKESFSEMMESPLPEQDNEQTSLYISQRHNYLRAVQCLPITNEPNPSCECLYVEGNHLHSEENLESPLET